MLCVVQRPLFLTSFVSIACADLITIFVMTTEEWCIYSGSFVQHPACTFRLFSELFRLSVLARPGMLVSRTLS
jgi:hypothetical protein